MIFECKMDNPQGNLIIIKLIVGSLEASEENLDNINLSNMTFFNVFRCKDKGLTFMLVRVI